MHGQELASWLLENAGPVIRFRVLVDVLRERNISVVARSLDDLLESREVLHWLGNLHPDTRFGAVHTGHPYAFENAVGKLVQLGVRAGLQPFDILTLPFRVWLTENTNCPPLQPHAVFHRTVVSSFLSLAGYDGVAAVEEHIHGRLDVVYEFARNPDMNHVFVDRQKIDALPHGSYLDSHEVVDPELYPNQQLKLPWIHDIHGFAHLKSIMDEPLQKQKAETIVKMILTKEFQALPWSYGLAKYGRKYYVLGWAPRLPGFSSKPEGREFAEMLLMMQTLAPFGCVRESDWFRRGLDYLEEFVTPEGTFSFPRAWLPEKKRGYWIGGEYMAFDTRSNGKKSIECESTFRVLMILHRSGHA